MRNEVEPVVLRLRRIIEEDEGRKLAPGLNTTMNLRQSRAYRTGVMKARNEGRITVATARAELGAVDEVQRRLEAGAPTVRAVPVQLARLDDEYPVRRRREGQSRSSQKQARKAGRPKKKSKSRKRR